MIYCTYEFGKIKGHLDHWTPYGTNTVIKNPAHTEWPYLIEIISRNSHSKHSLPTYKKRYVQQTWTLADPQKLKCELNYVGKKLHGPFIENFSDGSRYVRCTYINGKKDGLYEQWNEAGILVQQMEFKDGQHHGFVKTWNDYGTISSDQLYKFGDLDGEYDHIERGQRVVRKFITDDDDEE